MMVFAVNARRRGNPSQRGEPWPAFSLPDFHCSKTGGPAARSGIGPCPGQCACGAGQQESSTTGDNAQLAAGEEPAVVRLRLRLHVHGPPDLQCC